MIALIPSANQFVLAAEAGVTSISTATVVSIGATEPLHGHPDLLLLRLADASRSPREAWEQVRQMTDPMVSVQPVMLDQHGGAHYPTGRVVARFRRALEWDEVTAVAKRHTLEPMQQNAYVATQFVFAPERFVYVPDVVAAIQAEADVEHAWPETLSRYRRIRGTSPV